MASALPTIQAPELVIGLVAPIGVDLDMVVSSLSRCLKEMEYDSRELRLTGLMRELPVDLTISDAPHIQSYKDRIAFANQARKLFGDDVLASIAISAIRSDRASEGIRRELAPESAIAAVEPEEIPIPGRAYIIRQLKRPDEIALLRSVYGKQFIQLSAYAPERIRLRRIENLERSSRGGLMSDVEAHKSAYEIIAQDSKEAQDRHGQNVRDAFPLGDVFIDASTPDTCLNNISRFIRLLFGSNEIGPTRDEYGMYIAKSASLRSLDLSRQVGAAIFWDSGEVITLGCNEVPKAGGGTYWSGDDGDQRDIVAGSDPNEKRKVELLVDLIDRLRKTEQLSDEILKIGDAYAITKHLLQDKSDDGVSESKLMDLLEFGRIIHAEMSALSDAARKGLSVKNATLFCTTFPCHLCAKHIVAAGIARVVYLEPYPKSYAGDLHGDAIDLEGEGVPGKVRFEPFVGLSPFRYRDLFEKGKRKYSGGLAQKFNRGVARPMIEVFFPSYFEAETHIAARLESSLGAQAAEGGE